MPRRQGTHEIREPTRWALSGLYKLVKQTVGGIAALNLSTGGIEQFLPETACLAPRLANGCMQGVPPARIA